MSKCLNALNVEIRLHLAVLFALIIPLYCIAVPQYFLMRTAVDGYATARLALNSFSSYHLPSVQEEIFGGHVLEWTSWPALGALLLGGAVLFARRASFRPKVGDSASPARIDRRRYRKLPARYESALTEFLQESWIAANASGKPPKLYCFVAPSVMACAFSDAGEPAIAISSGMIERWSQGDKSTTKVVLLHEIGHVMCGDESKLPRAKALLMTVRDCLCGLVACGALVGLVRFSLEAFGVGSDQSSDIPIAAYVRATVMPSFFALLGLVVLARYISLITMLIELRADLSAAISLGGIENFKQIVERDSLVSASGWRARWNSLVGLKVTHLTPGERLRFLTEPQLLLMPKLRYFSLSFALPVLLLLIGRSGFVSSSARGSLGFQWVISAGLIGAATAVYLAVFLLIANAEQGTPFKLSLRTSLRLTAALSISSYLLLINEYRLINRIDEFMTALLMEQFRGSWGDEVQRLWAIVAVVTEPLTATQNAVIPMVWIVTIWVFLWSFSRAATRRAKPWTYLAVATALATGMMAERVLVDDLPGYSIKQVLPAVNLFIESRYRLLTGPLVGLIPLFVSLLVVLASSAVSRLRSERYDRTSD